MSNRNSNIELLRIISMLLIVCGHFVQQSGEFNICECVNDLILIFISSASRISVKIFLLIGIWYMVDSEFKAKKVLKLYFELFLYCYILTIFSAFFVKDLELFSTVKCFFRLFYIHYGLHQRI